MKTRSEIEELATRHLEDAFLLLQQHRYDNAYYLGGYAVELFLKAKICKTFGVDKFFSEEWMKDHLKNPKTFRIHDFHQLLIFAGLLSEIEDEEIQKSWENILAWNESSRYMPAIEHEKVITFLQSVKKFSTWIKQYL